MLKHKLMDEIGIKAKIWYGAEDVPLLQKALGKNFLVWVSYENNNFLNIRPYSDSNKKAMDRDIKKIEGLPCSN